MYKIYNLSNTKLYVYKNKNKFLSPKEQIEVRKEFLDLDMLKNYISNGVVISESIDIRCNKKENINKSAIQVKAEYKKPTVKQKKQYNKKSK